MKSTILQFIGIHVKKATRIMKDFAYTIFRTISNNGQMELESYKDRETIYTEDDKNYFQTKIVYTIRIVI